MTAAQQRTPVIDLSPFTCDIGDGAATFMVKSELLKQFRVISSMVECCGDSDCSDVIIPINCVDSMGNSIKMTNRNFIIFFKLLEILDNKIFSRLESYVFIEDLSDLDYDDSKLMIQIFESMHLDVDDLNRFTIVANFLEHKRYLNALCKYIAYLLLPNVNRYRLH